MAMGTLNADVNHLHTFTTANSNPHHGHGIYNDGGGQAHENQPPFYVLTYIIRKG
jgi:microcystin-dependent protein